MGRERAARVSAHGAARLSRLVLAATLVMPALSGCETLPGMARQTQPSQEIRPAVVPPMPPPARPRVPSMAGARFREMGPAPIVEATAAPPPPPSPSAPIDAAPSPPPSAARSGTELLGDSAASEVAGSEPSSPAAAPAPPIVASVPTPAGTLPPPPIDPASTVGATADALRERFGAPQRQTPIGSGTTWHYEREICRASFVLLPELASGALRVFSYEITPPEGALFGPAGCLGRLAAPRGDRRAGTAP